MCLLQLLAVGIHCEQHAILAGEVVAHHRAAHNAGTALVPVAAQAQLDAVLFLKVQPVQFQVEGIVDVALLAQHVIELALHGFTALVIAGPEVGNRSVLRVGGAGGLPESKQAGAQRHPVDKGLSQEGRKGEMEGPKALD